MRTLLWISFASLLASAYALAAADFSGKWANPTHFMTLKQEGNKLSGTGGPTEKDQTLTFDNGTVEGDHIVFKVGTYQFDLRLVGEELKGEIRIGAEIQPVFFKRAADGSVGPRSFEVASVKRSPPPTGDGINSSMRLNPGQLTCTNVSLKKLIWESYGVKEYQVAGPDWIRTELYDIAAKLPVGATGDDVRLMIQSLLAERFKLTMHRESKEMPVYALVVGKAGSKLREVEFGRGSTSFNGRTLTATRVPLRNFTEFLSRQTALPVLDMTGLKGIYSFTLNYAPEEAPTAPGTAPGTPTTTESAVGPSLFTAIQEQLGLKLEARKAPVEMLVVDHAEKVPTEN